MAPIEKHPRTAPRTVEARHRSQFARRSQRCRAQDVVASAPQADGAAAFPPAAPIGPYIVDFYCAAARLVIEMNGAQHGADKAVAYDSARTAWLEARGFHVLRIWNHEFFENPEEVLEGIWRTLKDRNVSLPSP